MLYDLGITPELESALTAAWLFFNAVLVLWMQIGFALLEVGAVRSRFVKNILIKNVLDGALAIIVWWAVGFAFSGNNGNSVVGTEHFFGDAMDTAYENLYGRWVFGLAFASSSATIVSGAIAERCQIVAYLIFTAVSVGIIYPFAAHWLWTDIGWMSHYNVSNLGSVEFIDFAGGTVVHGMGGISALVAISILGPRVGRFGIQGAVHMGPPEGYASVFKVMGTMILFISFLPFNAGSLIEFSRVHLANHVASNTCIGSAFGCFTIMAISVAFKRFDYDLSHSLDGLIAGAVAATGCAGVVEPWAAAVIGIIGGVLCERTKALLLRLKLDDVANAVGMHFLPGVWGTLACGFFANNRIRDIYSLPTDTAIDVGIFYGGNGKLLGRQILGITVLLSWAAFFSFICFYSLKLLGLLRVPDEEQQTVHARQEAISERVSSSLHGKPNVWSQPHTAASSAPINRFSYPATKTIWDATLPPYNVNLSLPQHDAVATADTTHTIAQAQTQAPSLRSVSGSTTGASLVPPHAASSERCDKQPSVKARGGGRHARVDDVVNGYVTLGSDSSMLASGAALQSGAALASSRTSFSLDHLQGVTFEEQDRSHSSNTTDLGVARNSLGSSSLLILPLANRLVAPASVNGSRPASPLACGASPCTAHPLNTNQGSFVRCHSNGTVPAPSHSPPERLDRGDDSRRAQSSRSLHKSWPDSVDYSLEEEDGDPLEVGSSGRRITPP